MPKEAPGYFKVFRKIFNNEELSEKPFDKFHAWIWLISEANYEDGITYCKGRRVEVRRGQLVTSYTSLADAWGWNRNKAIRFVEWLVKERMVEKRGTHDGIFIDIVKYGQYQGRNAKRYADGYADGYAETVENTGVDGNQRYGDRTAKRYADGTHLKNNKEYIRTPKPPKGAGEEGPATKKWREIERREAEKRDAGRY